MKLNLRSLRRNHVGTSPPSLHRQSHDRKLLLHSSFTSVGSNESSFFVDDYQNCASVPAPSAFSSQDDEHAHTNTRPRVRFCQDHENQVIEATPADSDDSATSFRPWFSRRQIATFKTETMCIAKAIAQADACLPVDASHTWPRQLAQAYQVFQEQQTEGQHDDKIDHVTLALPTTTATASLVGLDKWVLQAMSSSTKKTEKDKALDRRRLCQLWQIWDNDMLHQDQAHQAVEHLAQTSRDASRSSRLYAVHLARWWAENKQDN